MSLFPFTTCVCSYASVFLSLCVTASVLVSFRLSVIHHASVSGSDVFVCEHVRVCVCMCSTVCVIHCAHVCVRVCVRQNRRERYRVVPSF